MPWICIPNCFFQNPWFNAKIPMKNNIFTPLIHLYEDMDAKWEIASNAYSFTCNGCKDNCCKSLFFHHTYVEQAYLRHGFSRLASDKKQQILDLAKAYCEKTFAAGNDTLSLKIMCPVNEKGRCLLYAFRPMICRLHGLPHELHRPGASPIQGPGCEAGRFENLPYYPFDRTLFYQQMTRVEMAYRQTYQLSGKSRLTISQILLSETPEEIHGNG